MTVLFTVLSLSVLATISQLSLSWRTIDSIITVSVRSTSMMAPRSLQVNGGSSLLSSLASQKVFIPSAGGKATCGLCKSHAGGKCRACAHGKAVYIRRGEGSWCSSVLPGESQARSEDQDSRGTLQHQAVPHRVSEIKPLTHDIKQFRFELLEPQTIDFKAGQYVQVDSKPYDKVKESVSRAYSISSVPSDRNHIELIIRLVPGGICTTFLHQHLKEGDEITFAGPFGQFYLHEGGDELIFIAGGSGLAPIRSLVLDILEKNLDKKMKFFFGAVRKRDLYYVDFFRDLEKRYVNFNTYPPCQELLLKMSGMGKKG